MDSSTLEEIFNSLDIDYSYPGFYNDRNFIIAEKEKKDFLNNYPMYLQKKPYASEYISKAKSIIPKIVKLFSNEIIKDGRLSMCVNSSLLLSQILEKEGFWNFVVKGSVTVKFQGRYICFSPFDINKSGLGHVWLVATPFLIVDTTIKMQPYSQIDTSTFPDFICSENAMIGVAGKNDLINEELINQLTINGYRGDIVEHCIPRYKSFFQDFPVLLINKNEIEFKYIPVAFSASEEKLEDNPHRINNYSALELYKKIINQLE